MNSGPPKKRVDGKDAKTLGVSVMVVQGPGGRDPHIPAIGAFGMNLTNRPIRSI